MEGDVAGLYGSDPRESPVNIRAVTAKHLRFVYDEYNEEENTDDGPGGIDDWYGAWQPDEKFCWDTGAKSKKRIAELIGTTVPEINKLHRDVKKVQQIWLDIIKDEENEE